MNSEQVPTPELFVVVTTIRRTDRETGLITHVWGPYPSLVQAHEARTTMLTDTPPGHYRNPTGGFRARVHRLQPPHQFDENPTELA